MPQGFVAKMYQLTLRAYLAFALDSIYFDGFAKSVISDIIAVLAAFAQTSKV